MNFSSKEDIKLPWSIDSETNIMTLWKHPTEALIMLCADGWHYKRTGLPWVSGISEASEAVRFALGVK